MIQDIFLCTVLNYCVILYTGRHCLKLITEMSFEDNKLVQAVKANDLKEVQKLLQSGNAETNVQDSTGKTLLHVVIESKASADIFKHLLDEVDIGIRDQDGNSVAELAFSDQTSEDIKEVLTNFLKGQILSGNIDKLHKLLLSGWSVWPIQVEQAKNVSKELEEFVEKLPEFQGKITAIHKAIQEDNLRDVQNLLDRKVLMLAADRTGLSPLHKAVVLGHTEIAVYLGNEYKDALNLKDNMDRTPLHYAGGSHDAGNLYEELIKAGADNTITDLSGKTPKDYYDDPSLLSVMDVREKIKTILDRPLIDVQREKSAKKCHNMYISTEFKKQDVPPPTTVDGKYVAEHLGTALTLALAEIAERRPWDPIEYLGQWLHKYGENQKFVKQQEELLIRLRQAEEEKEQENEQKQRIKAEQKELQEIERQQREKEEEERKKKEQEELQRKAKEAALAQRPNLETVAEEGEEETTNKDKDTDVSKGQTELHKLAAQHGADMAGLIKLGYNIADRDCNNKTPRDIAQDSNIDENVQAIDAYVQDLIEKGDFDVLQKLMLDGYDHIQTVLEKLATEGQLQDTANLMTTIPEFQEKVKSVLMASQYSNTESMKELLETPKVIQAKDHCGRCPLHIAVLTVQKDIAEYIITNHPESVQATDNMKRTPLHYAMALSEEITALLTSNGADSDAKDINGRDPDYYKNNPEDIKSIQSQLMSPTDGASEGQQQDQGQDGETQQNADSSSEEQQSQQEQEATDIINQSQQESAQ
ncbi:hypothetical protein KUTeg_008480 [Tegillarca granosa]|uniref:Uncharacterized protein n=1 Tax=Tegillarca granosa TaxID=220873 RepID=A0ABQ9F9B7_TEGGR|nr:hypothetical protein KUTeg_008480 [Tegillarca granosa]